MLTLLTQWMIGFSLFSLVLLWMVYWWVFKAFEKTWLSKIACSLMLTAMGLLQWHHWQWLELGQSVFDNPFYAAILFTSAPAFYLFSRELLQFNTRNHPALLLHFLPIVLSPWLSGSLALPIAFSIGSGYALWLCLIVFKLRDQRAIGTRHQDHITHGAQLEQLRHKRRWRIGNKALPANIALGLDAAQMFQRWTLGKLAQQHLRARIDGGTQTVVGVNKFQLDGDEDVPVLKVDNAAVRRMQLDKLARLKADRDQAEVTAKLDAIARAAETGKGNLLALAVDAARAKATVGEISEAVERSQGRHQAVIRSIKGVYGGGVTGNALADDATKRASAFEAKNGRRPKIYIAKMGQDGHDRGQKVVDIVFCRQVVQAFQPALLAPDRNFVGADGDDVILTTAGGDVGRHVLAQDVFFQRHPFDLDVGVLGVEVVHQALHADHVAVVHGGDGDGGFGHGGARDDKRNRRAQKRASGEFHL